MEKNKRLDKKKYHKPKDSHLGQKSKPTDKTKKERRGRKQF